MKLKLAGAMSSVIALGLWAGCDVEQPDPGCRVPHGFTNEMFVKLTPVEGQNLTGACATKNQEIVGIDQYQDPNSDEALIAIRTFTLGEQAFDPAATGDANSVGPYMTEVPPDGVCVAEELSKATINLPEVPEEMLPDGGISPAIPASSESFQWRNVRIFSTAAIPGTQMTAEGTYEKDGCTMNFTAIGVYPPVSCENLDGEPDDRLCDVNAEPTDEEREAGIVPGCRDIGIPECLNPTFVMKCDPETLHCIPQEFGLLKDGNATAE